MDGETMSRALSGREGNREDNYIRAGVAPAQQATPRTRACEPRRPSNEKPWGEKGGLMKTVSILRRPRALLVLSLGLLVAFAAPVGASAGRDRKSTRLNSSHANISYAVFCLRQ